MPFRPARISPHVLCVAAMLIWPFGFKELNFCHFHDFRMLLSLPANTPPSLFQAAHPAVGVHTPWSSVWLIVHLEISNQMLSFKKKKKILPNPPESICSSSTCYSPLTSDSSVFASHCDNSLGGHAASLGLPQQCPQMGVFNKLWLNG